MRDTSAGCTSSESFEYDHLGNRLLDQLGQFNYDNKSQRLTSDYKFNYLYDNNGNLVQKSEKGLNGNFINYTYSSENQLVKIEEYKDNILQVSSNYSYDAIGRRFKKEIVNHQDSLKSFSRGYQYDGQEIIAEYDGDNSLLAIYTHSGLRTDDVLAVDVRSNKLANQTGSYFYLKDALGSITDIANASGELIQSYQYSSFGKLLSIRDKDSNVITEDPILKTSFTYTNREYDEESGMYYYRARYYEPSIGRFLQEDPHPGAIGEPNTFLSKHIYVANNPINYIDPKGEFLIVPFLVAAAKIAATGIVVGAIFGSLNYIVNGGDGGFLNALLQGAAIGGGAALGAAGAGALLGLLGVGGSGLVAGKILGAGLGGGLAAMIVGGKFKQGFWMGATGEALGLFDSIGNLLWGTAHAPTLPPPAVTPPKMPKPDLRIIPNLNLDFIPDGPIIKPDLAFF